MYSHYVIVLDWATEDDSDVQILGVKHALDDAQEVFNKYIKEQKEIAKENEYEIESDHKYVFSAGIMGCWRDNHTTLYIQGVI